MVGLIDDLSHVTRSQFHVPGASIVLFGLPTDELGASEYLARVHGLTAGPPPACDLDAERRAIDALLESIAGGLVLSAHDCSDGGLAVALAECCIGSPEQQLGADVTLDEFSDLPLRALLFGEAQGRILIATSHPKALLDIARKHNVPASSIGTVNDSSYALRISAGQARLSVSLNAMATAYHDAIPALMSRSAGDAALIEHVAVGAV